MKIIWVSYENHISIISYHLYHVIILVYRPSELVFVPEIKLYTSFFKVSFSISTAKNSTTKINQWEDRNLVKIWVRFVNSISYIVRGQLHIARCARDIANSAIYGN